MRNPKDSSRLYFLRRHLQLAHAKGTLSTMEYHAALEFLMDREEEALRNRQGKIPFHYEKAELLRQGLRILESHQVLPMERVNETLALPIGEAAPVTPIFDHTADEDPDLVEFQLLCPTCESNLPTGSTTCPSCNPSLVKDPE